jgi:phenylacetate-CoA ligase
LRSLLPDACALMPQRRRLFGEYGFDTGSVRGLADLQSLPLLTQAEIRGGSDDSCRPQAGSLVRFNTVGGPGAPLLFCVYKERVSRGVAAAWRATRRWGMARSRSCRSRES